jgi:predicted RND superfamily exporter protein
MFRLSQNHKIVHRYYAPILIVAFVSSLIGGYYASKLTLKSDLAELLPGSFESVKALREIENEVGGVGNLQVVVETNDMETAKKFAHDLAPRLLESPNVNYLDFVSDIEFYNKYGLLLLEMEEIESLHQSISDKVDAEKQKANPLFVDDLFGEEEEDEADATDDWASWEERYEDLAPREYYINSDSTALIMKILPTSANTDLDFAQRFYEEIKGIVETVDLGAYDSEITVHYSGNLKSKIDEYNVLKNDILGTAAYGFGGVFLLIVLYFRRLTGAILITLTLIMSLAWTFGITYWVIGDLNTITGFMFVILFGLGIDYGIHAFARYVEGRKSGLAFVAAIEKMVAQTGRALVTTAVTTSAAFFSLTFMDFRGFSDLGFIAGVGMLFALVAMVIVLPAFITLVEKMGLMRIKQEEGKTSTVERRVFKFATPILLISGLLSLFSIYSFTQVEFEYDFSNLRANIEARNESSERSRGAFKLSESPAVVLTETKEEIKDVVAAVRKIMESDTSSPTVKDVRSVYSIVPDDQPEKLVEIRKIRKLVEEEADGVVKGEDKERLDKLKEFLQVDEPYNWDDFPENDKRKFVNKRGEIGNFVFIYPSVALKDGRNAIDFRDDIGKITTSSGKTYFASSSNIITAEMLIIMIGEGEIAVLSTLAVVFLLVLLDFRSFKAALFVLTPLAVGVLWMGTAMYLSGMKLNFFNIVVFPSIIGIGVDNGVHIYHRYKEEGPGSLYHVLKNTGMAVTMTTATTVVGYSGLILASHPGLNSIGDLASMGLLSTYATALILLPALLQFFEKKEITAPSGS